MNILTNKKNWPSEYTRGMQVADALGCRFNQPLDELDETIIYVKCLPHENVIKRMKKMHNVYIDLIDDADMIDVIRRFPTIKVIVLTDIMKDFLSQHIKNDIVVIPEHSCNFAQAIRTRKRIKVVGYIGSSQCFDLDLQEVRDALKNIGLDFQVAICETADENTREQVCDFYKRIDIQLAFRLPDKAVRPPIYRNPLKIFNAGSFKIPTLAYPELAYRLCAPTMYLPVISLDDIVAQCYCLKYDNVFYDFYAQRAQIYSRQFDISHIAHLYAKLSPGEMFDIKKNIKRMRGVACSTK